jgi:hypothetical protein
MPDYKAQFAVENSLELSFSDRDGNAIGMLKIKQSTILWKPHDGKKYRSVPLEKFANWILHPETGASMVKG